METLGISLLGGAIFYVLNLPLPWTLGPLLFVLIWKAKTGRHLCWPIRIRNCGLVVLSGMMGAWFTPETGRQIVLQLPGMLLVTGSSLLFGFGAAVFTSRQTGVSLASSLLGSTPGGLSQMTVLCDEIANTDRTVVTMLQTVRMLSVIFIVPFLAIHGVADSVKDVQPVVSHAPVIGFNQTTGLYATAALVGAAIAWRISLPNPFMLGPLLGVAALGVAGMALPRTPLWLSASAQVLVAAYLGVSSDVSTLRQQKKLIVYALLGALAVVASSLLSAWILTWFYPVALTTAFLSAAPGGITEMGLTAAMIDADVSIVSAYQLFRLLFIMIVVTYFFRWWLGSRTEPETDSP